MSDPILAYLAKHGPARSSKVAAALRESGITPEAARQRLSRAREPVVRFPISLLPKREAFLYLQRDRHSERFWRNFLHDLRESGSVYAAAVDGLIAKGGIATAEEFAVVSGAPVIPMRGQVSVEVLAKQLVKADFISYRNDLDLGPYYAVTQHVGDASWTGVKARQRIERAMLDSVREWARNIGLAGYNSIQIRGEPEYRRIGPFAFDMAGPSYLLPLRGAGTRPGFLVVDLFSEGTLSAEHVEYFIRKARALSATLPDIGILPILIADSFTGSALTAGHAGGVMLATLRNLFGKSVAAALADLLTVLKNAAAYASSQPERLVGLVDRLADIEGRDGNLRGILFELIAAYLARLEAVSIDMGVKARDSSTGKSADIDIQKVLHHSQSVVAIECKGKIPGGVLERFEVEHWLEKLPIIRAHYREHYSLREAHVRFELWTSGAIAQDALELLKEEQAKRTKSPIGWKDGTTVLALAHQHKQKAISDALSQHFLRHPLADTYIDQSHFAPTVIAASSYNPLGSLTGTSIALPSGNAITLTRRQRGEK